MRRLREVVQLRATAGDPVTVGDVTVTPRARVVIVRVPFGGFVWNQPTSVLVSRHGVIQRRPILDLSTTLWIAALGASVLALVLARFLPRPEESESWATRISRPMRSQSIRRPIP